MNHFISSRLASAASQGNSKSPWPGPLSRKRSNQAMKEFHLLRDVSHQRGDLVAHRLYEFAFRLDYTCFRTDMSAPSRIGQRWI